MNVNRILPLMLLLVLFASCSRKYKVEGVSSVTSLDGKMLYLKTLRDGQWITIDSAEVVHGLDVYKRQRLFLSACPKSIRLMKLLSG